MMRIQNKLSGLLIAVFLFVMANLVFSFFYLRFDLTTEGRYTISKNSKELLHGLKTPVYIKLYLAGNLNSGFRNLSKSTKEMLDEMELLSAASFKYVVVDPTEGSDEERSAVLKDLKAFKAEAIPVYETLDDGSKRQLLVYPYFKMSIGDKALMVNLLENIPGLSGVDNLNKSIEMLEFKIIDAVRKLSIHEKPKIAFLEGQGELNELEVIDVTKELSSYYRVERGAIQNDASVLNEYKCVIIAAPIKHFSEKDKFVLDQYVMGGGNLLVLTDGISLSLDSLQNSPITLGLPFSVNLDDLLFTYGFRINSNVIQDIQCGMIPVNVAAADQTPKFVPAPWYFNPLLLPSQQTPITRNINVVKGEFVSTIDTVGDDLKVNRKILLASSRFSKMDPTPVTVSLLSINKSPDKASFNRSFLPIAALASGSFPSAFQFRSVPQQLTNVRPARESSLPAKIIVVADGDIIRNEVRFRDSQPQIVPLGYDEISHQTFGNRDFIVNSVNYLCDDAGWMELRNRSNILRLLDKSKVADSISFYRILNVFVPIMLLIVSGLAFFLIRRRAQN